MPEPEPEPEHEPEAEPEPEPEHEPEAEPEPEPEPEHEPEAASSPQPSSTTTPAAETTSQGSACVPTNYAYRLYCADQSAAGSCPAPWCGRGVVALQAGKARKASARHHGFLGSALIQEGVSLERRPAASAESWAEL